MISDALQKWTVVIVIFLGAVFSQIPMMQMQYPMSGPYGPMMMQAPAPQPIAMPVPVPVAIPIPYLESTTTTTTTTTTSRPNGEGSGDGDIRIPIAIPVPVPHFVQIAIPGYNSQICQNGDGNNNGKNKGNGKNCPPCPPCTCNPCTPSFFAYCSPCHLQCRCKKGQENPTPQEPRPPNPLPGPAYPMPIPIGPPPVVIVPFPPQFNNRPEYPDGRDSQSSDCNTSSSRRSSSKEDSSCDSEDSRRKKKRKKKGSKKKGKYDIYRRNFGFMKKNHKDDKLVRPVLTYMSRDGKIKMKRRLSNDEASALLGEQDTIQNVHLMAGEDSKEQSRVVVMSKPNMRSGSSHRRRKILLQNGMSNHMLGDGKKELVFNPPHNKKISNLSVSFQIAK